MKHRNVFVWRYKIWGYLITVFLIMTQTFQRTIFLLWMMGRKEVTITPENCLFPHQNILYNVYESVYQTKWN